MERHKMNIYDVGIIGMGIAGSFACLRLAKEHRDKKIITFELGRPPAKRRRQLEGFLGCLPNSDGKFFQSDLSKVIDLCDRRKVKSSHKFVEKSLSEVGDFKIIKDRGPSSSFTKKIKTLGYDIINNDYIQVVPSDIHSLSKYIASTIENNKNIHTVFDNEVLNISKMKKNIFAVTLENGEYYCKKIIIAAGRSGWRWASQLYKNFGIVEENNIAKFGIRIEMPAKLLKELNKSTCSLIRDDMELGPFSWNGTIIPEDHIDMAISSFRSNESRWKSDKVSFNLIGNRPFPNQGFEQTDRVGKLTFVITNDRIIKERVSHIITGKSKISILKDEYGWLPEVLTELGTVMPELLTKGYYHAPTIIPSAPKINIGNNLETEIDGMFVAGESAGIHGILSAGLSGALCAESVCK